MTEKSPAKLSVVSVLVLVLYVIPASSSNTPEVPAKTTRPLVNELTVNPVRVPTEVIAVWAAVDRVPASVVAVNVPVTVAPPVTVASLTALS